MATQEKRNLSGEQVTTDRQSGLDGGLAEITAQPLWRIRLRLLRERAAVNWRLFTENRIGLVGLGIIVLFGLMAVAHPILLATVWDPKVYDPVSGYSAPKVERVVVEDGVQADPSSEINLTKARLRGHPDAEVGDTVAFPEQPAPPSAQHPLGTDPIGRDVLSQLLYGSRAAFLLGATAAIVTVLLATTVGAAAAYFGGLTDSVLMRIADLFLLLPLIPVLAFATALFEPDMMTLGLMIGLVSGFGGVAIVLKSQALAVKVKPFIDAARVAGGGHPHIIFRHIIPNVMPLSFLYMMFTVTAAISTEATLSFLGLLDVPMSWGIMIHVANSEGYLLAGTAYWWLLLPAGLAVTLLAAAFYFVGRALDEVVNPRLRRR